MTPKERAAMQQALEALEICGTDDMAYIKSEKAITALREALAIRCHGCAYCNNSLFAGTKCNNCGRVVEQTVSQEYQDHLVNQSFDWSAMAAKHQFMEGYRIGLAEMREACAKVVLDDAWALTFQTFGQYRTALAAAIRAIKFEGDTGFRPVSEMVAEHKQDPKKGAAIEKAKVRKAEQKPVGVVEGSGEWGIAGVLVAGVPIGTKLYAAPVRQVDLSDDEIADALYGKGCWRLGVHPVHLREYRRVIQADREKNK